MNADVIPVWQSLAGGALIGAGAAVLLLFDGQVAGISGIVDRVLHRALGEQAWRVAFLAGLLLPAAALGAGPIAWQAPPATLAVAGALVGFGTRIGSGCTSGHGVCGIANLSPRSLVATGTFIAVAIVTVLVVRTAAGT
jgi:uncharacterized membrane protein YedE/YeeE